jgi:DNA-binding XRE family transcriptional regulator
MPKQSATQKALPAFDLKAAREAQSMTQIQCAEELCSGQSSIARWEADGSLPEIYRKYWALRFPRARPTKPPKRKKSAGKNSARVVAGARPTVDTTTP